MGLISYKTIQKCDLEGLEVAYSRGFVRKRGFRPAEGSKVRNFADNGSPNDLDEVILNLPEVLRGSECFKLQGRCQCNVTKQFRGFQKGRTDLFLSYKEKSDFLAVK